MTRTLTCDKDVADFKDGMEKHFKVVYDLLKGIKSAQSELFQARRPLPRQR